MFIKRREDIETKKNANELIMKSKEELMLRVQRFGLWTSCDDMEHCLSHKKEKVAALKSQINFRRKVLGQVHVIINHKQHNFLYYYKRNIAVHV